MKRGINLSVRCGRLRDGICRLGAGMYHFPACFALFKGRRPGRVLKTGNLYAVEWLRHSTCFLIATPCLVSPLCVRFFNESNQ
jgi:hypothetical protein